MVGEENSNNTISKKNTGFPPYLDFDQLRRQSIEYLGKLSGQIWTDHNVHDPGITILEMLCYALLDLGYRTQLPIEDVLAPHPIETGKDNNFFTPAQILSCNPLTITDYRKLLIDVKGVKNAWLQPATDVKDICRLTQDPAGASINTESVYLNGLYHVYIELEDYPNATENIAEYAKPVLQDVKATLMAHRNLCEDFVDIFILCKLETGVCASIELEDDADAETVYIAIAEKLNNFFSPVPKFYTLQQMLDKKIPIETIFEGRPYSASSFGFTDTTELEAIQLNKEIHLSDVYNVFFTIPGVKKVTALQLRTCDVNGKTRFHNGWKLALPKNTIPAFSVSCSGFEFTNNGLPIAVNVKKMETFLSLNFSTSGKATYSIDSPYLDIAIPKGNYIEELAVYSSIQNDFPEVYGIGEGQLPANVNISRKAKALQLKGYLLFFDQLLANYLTQLKNIRSLFAFNTTINKTERHTYFFNELKTVPEMNSLLRFSANNNDIAKEGETLVFPVSMINWQQLSTQTGNMQDALMELSSFVFDTMDAVQNAIQLLLTDVISEAATTVQVIQAVDNTWYYGIFTTATEYILVSKKTFIAEAAAKQHASSVQYSTAYENNYQTFITNSNQFSFNVEFNITSYADYLQLIIEDDNLYNTRRQGFLQHLLARFSEKFADFALLNWQDKQAIETTENFLSNYDDLSRNRGRAYNYSANEYTIENISGFEKKVKALSGITPVNNTLCHFVVEACEDYYVVSLQLDKQIVFNTAEKFDLRAEGEMAAEAMIKALSHADNYRVQYVSHDKKYELQLHYGRSMPAIYATVFNNSVEAEALMEYLLKSIAYEKYNHEIAISKYIWRSALVNHKNETIAQSVTEYENEEAAKDAGVSLAKETGNTQLWRYNDSETPLVLQTVNTAYGEQLLVNVSAFKIDIDDTIIGKPDKFTYDILDQKHSFKILPLLEFDSVISAKEHSILLLVAAANISNWRVMQDNATNRFAVQLFIQATLEATCLTQYATYDEALIEMKRIAQLIQEHIYTIAEIKHPSKWKFFYNLGYQQHKIYKFESTNDYTTYEKAVSAAMAFHTAIPKLNVINKKDTIQLRAQKNATIPTVHYLSVDNELLLAEQEVNNLIEQQKAIRQATDNTNNNSLSLYVKLDRQTEENSYLYKLVNKNHVPVRSVKGYTEKDQLLLLKRKLAGYYKQQQWAPMVCLGGDIITKRVDEQATIWYHYNIRFRNLPFVNGYELTVFTSTQGYLTYEAAEKAFNENYLPILQLAADKSSYEKCISLQPIYLPNVGTKENKNVIAYVNEDAIKIFTAQFNNNWLAKIIAIAAAYPIKSVEYGSAAFAILFCKQPKETPVVCKGDKKIKWVYYFDFSLKDIPENIDDSKWISTNYFETPELAMQEFVYFNRLLAYAGNWFIDCDICEHNATPVYRFYLHEVLAESIHCFKSIDEAWGPTGVEAFICAVQSGKGIHQYLRKSDCCYSFYTTCGEGILQHPCTYDTPEKRDKAMDELYNSIKQLSAINAFETKIEKDNIIINNSKGQPIARVSIKNGNTNCDTIINAVEAVQVKDNLWQQNNGAYNLSTKVGNVIIHSHENLGNITLAVWRDMLEEWACFFPITRTVVNTKKANAVNGNIQVSYSYCIEIKVSGFSSCEKNEIKHQPCTCESPVTKSNAFCYAAWISPCCFTSCEEAIRVLAEADKLFANFDNFKAVFDCSCGSYGIALHTDAVVDNAIRPATTISNFNNAIIARNPQCYQTPHEVCIASNMVMQLVNAAGLKVVEHILLRPHCSEDCQCEERNKYCDAYGNCNYPPYVISSDDPCNVEADIPFLPGIDPYSFMATVVLPAWPSLLRNKQKRKQLEKIIYTEAPAHVLLRIIWLRPKDFCQFETAFKQWGQWLAQKNTCNNNFSLCNFLKLLFNKQYTCLDDCTICMPCNDKEIDNADDCTAERKRKVIVNAEYDFLNLVNETYCLSPYVCGDEVDRSMAHEALLPNAISVKENKNESLHVHKVEAIAPIAQKHIEEKQSKKEKSLTDLKHTQIIAADAIQKTVKEPTLIIIPNEKAQFVDSRHNRYVKHATSVVQHSGQNLLAEKTVLFLQDTQPAIEKLILLAKEIIQNKKPATKSSQSLNKNQTLDLLQAAVCYYLDSISFANKKVEYYDDIIKLMSVLKKAKIEVSAIYNYWDAASVVVYKPDIDINEIRKIM